MVFDTAGGCVHYVLERVRMLVQHVVDERAVGLLLHERKRGAHGRGDVTVADAARQMCFGGGSEGFRLLVADVNPFGPLGPWIASTKGFRLSPRSP